MLPWLARRVLFSAVMIILLVSAVFFIVRLAPGDPLDDVLVDTMGQVEKDLMRQRLGLDDGLFSQYLSWINGFMTGNWGSSLHQNRPVLEILGEAVGPTLLLTISSYFFYLALALGAALVMVRSRGSWLDRLIQGSGLVFYSLPGFWFGLMMIMLFSRQLGWLPTGGMHSPDAEFMTWSGQTWDLFLHGIMPVSVLALGSYMGMARYLRSSLEEVLSTDYILAARSRGLSENQVLIKHALPNALLPAITLVGMGVPFLIGGAVVVEVIFSWPGMGRVTVEAIGARDYPVIMGTTVVASLAVVAGSLIADILYRLADPRIRFDRGTTP
jgi:peptide/nickel transport system permease protein